eukprot:TRINITY_DN25041_c0_g1_i2.p1 TRINITY_DN25041_c0_g1~~TRINITY_DN25041_c0_g1_i2.p1  ORF type:complete len:292 (+),score=27.70 TRINITY_DN25041_c0_g1_i2:381-1256(+)
MILRQKMNEASPVARPNLEKPLEELSHDDIMQLTREDCRRYLKQRGMRRPSWNKSQAIQQVLSLKNLLSSSNGKDARLDVDLNETAPDSLLATCTQDFGESKMCESESKSIDWDWLKERELPTLASQPGIILSKESPHGTSQLTIFYSGQVNVYDDVSTEKAQDIMSFASQKEPFTSILSDSTHRPSPPAARSTVSSPDPESMRILNQEQKSFFCNASSVGSQEEKGPPCSRKASLERFLEKRKDRSRGRGASAEQKKPLLMGMFMHPSFVQRHYWSEVAKRKCNRPSSPK